MRGRTPAEPRRPCAGSRSAPRHCSGCATSRGSRTAANSTSGVMRWSPAGPRPARNCRTRSPTRSVPDTRGTVRCCVRSRSSRMYPQRRSHDGAPRKSPSHARSRSEDVMSQFEDLREDVLSSYVALTSLVTPHLADTRRRLLAESRARLAAGRFYVVVCGEFRRGKSRLLNALVERPGLFPVDVDITTCAVVTLHWDSRNSATVYFAESEPGNAASARSPEQIQPEEAGTYVKEQENPGNAKNVLRIDMGAPVE